MQPLIYKQRAKRWDFKRSMLASLTFHAFVLFGVSFVAIQQPWNLDEAAIVNIKFANSAFDMNGQSIESQSNPEERLAKESVGVQEADSSLDSQFSLRRLESNSTLESFEAAYLNAWQRKVETTGYYEILNAGIAKGNFKVQISSVIDSFGNLISADILQSSGNKQLDAFALKILKQSSPFQAFPKDMMSQYERLEIIRDWNFNNS